MNNKREYNRYLEKKFIKDVALSLSSIKVMNKDKRLSYATSKVLPMLVELHSINPPTTLPLGQLLNHYLGNTEVVDNWLGPLWAEDNNRIPKPINSPSELISVCTLLNPKFNTRVLLESIQRIDLYIFGKSLDEVGDFTIKKVIRSLESLSKGDCDCSVIHNCALLIADLEMSLCKSLEEKVGENILTKEHKTFIDFYLNVVRTLEFFIYIAQQLEGNRKFSNPNEVRSEIIGMWNSIYKYLLGKLEGWISKEEIMNNPDYCRLTNYYLNKMIQDVKQSMRIL